MVDSASQIKDFFLSLPITQSAHRIAGQFAAEQPTPEKAEQVRLNTLAVCVVNDYLQMMGISTCLTAGDSWNPVMRLSMNVADLEVTGVGRLECRPMGVYEQTCDIPPEVWESRIGYVVIQLDKSLREATVLGFTRVAMTEHLLISQLQPLEDLLVHLSQLMQPVAALTVGETLVTLSQWRDYIFETGWQAVESLLTPPEASLAFSFRADSSEGNDFNDSGKVRRAKLIDLGMQSSNHSTVIIVELIPGLEQIDIRLQMHPISSETYLLPLIQLIVLDEAGETFLEAQARRADNYIQLQFSGKPGEKFSVKVALGDISAEENFVI